MSLYFIDKICSESEISHTLWHEKYSPTNFEEIIGNENVVETVKNFLQNDIIPNLILDGPFGCGKTQLSKILVNKYLGIYKNIGHLEIIGSIQRGKSVVSEKTDKKKSSSSNGLNIIDFIKKSTNLPKTKSKIVTIYDFDCMTSEAQMALRRIIEIYANRVRFIFICEKITNVIEAIQSRCLVLKFQSISNELIIDKLKLLHKLNCDKKEAESIYEAICILSNGDLKQAINYLQMFASCKIQNQSNFYKIFNVPSIPLVKNILIMWGKNDTYNCMRELQLLIDDGNTLNDIIDIMIKILINSNVSIDARTKSNMIVNITKILHLNELNPSNIHIHRLVST